MGGLEFPSQWTGTMFHLILWHSSRSRGGPLSHTDGQVHITVADLMEFAVTQSEHDMLWLLDRQKETKPNYVRRPFYKNKCLLSSHRRNPSNISF